MTLKDKIAAAFAEVEYPGDDCLTSCNCIECRDSVELLRGKSWRQAMRDIPVEHFCGAQADCYGLAPAGMHYFIPALMLLSLDSLDAADFMPDMIVSHFASTPEDAVKDAAWIQQNVVLYSPEQRSVIVDFLRWLRSEWLKSSPPGLWSARIDSAIGHLTSTTAPNNGAGANAQPHGG